MVTGRGLPLLGQRGRSIVGVALFVLVAGVRLQTGDGAPSFLDFQALTLQQAVTDPILYKSWLAAKMSAAANSTTPACPIDVVCSKNGTLVYGSSTVTLTSTNSFHLVAAFSSSDSALAEPVTSASTFQDIPYANYIVSGNRAAVPHASTLDAFITGQGEQQGRSMAGVVKEWNLTINNGTPVSVLVTGMGTGATLAPLAALYFAVTYPAAHITAITFDNPTWALNNKANWTLTQLTDLYYFFHGNLNQYPQLSQATVQQLLGLSSNILLPSSDKLAADVLQMLKDSQVVQIFDSNGTDVTTLNYLIAPIVENTTSVIEPNKTQQEADYSPARLNETIAVWESVKNVCTPVFCKIRFPSVLQALIYEEYYPEDPEKPGPVRIGEVFGDYGPFQLILEAGKDADAMVGWVPDTETAYFVFRGSESQRDWLADFNIKQVPYPAISPGQAAVFNDPLVHSGLNNQFGELSLKANNKESNLAITLKKISNGAHPRVIVCTGQSLGGGLSHMCGPWAANRYPNASVFVVNEGSLKAGDANFTDFFNVLVGNAYRMVNGKDMVPLLSPTKNYEHVFRGWWLDNSTTTGPILMAEERDPLKINQSNWVDHSYYTYSILQMTINNVTAPNWVLDLNDSAPVQNNNGTPPPPPPKGAAPLHWSLHGWMFVLAVVVHLAMSLLM